MYRVAVLQQLEWYHGAYAFASILRRRFFILPHSPALHTDFLWALPERMEFMLTLDKIYHAAYVLKDVLRRTDLIKAPKINPNCNLYLKTENLQVTGSFKVRGAYYKISQLTDEEKDEQQKLRREYIDAYKASLHGVLSNSYIVRPDGTKEKVRRKKPQDNN